MKTFHALAFSLLVVLVPACKSAGQAPASAAATEAGLQVGRYAPKVGDKSTKTNDMSMVLTSAGNELKLVKHEEEAGEVLAIKGDTITKVKVSYGPRTQTQSRAGALTDKPSVIAGKAYIVWRADGAIEATMADGSPVSAEEVAELKNANKRLGNADVMAEIVASKTWMVGKKVVFTPEEVAEVNKRNERSGDEDMLVGLTLTLTAVDGQTATFAMDMTMAIAKGSMTFHVAGSTRIDVGSGRILEVGGSGEVTGDMGAPVTGTLTMNMAATY